MFVTEGNLSSGASETYQDIFSGIWLADYIGSLLDAGGKGVYFFHYLPLQMEPGCNSSPGTFSMFTVDASYKIQQPLAQFFVAQLINLEWAQPGGGEHQVYSAKADLEDGAGRELVTAYALKRPDGQWSLLVVNRDQRNSSSRSHCSFAGTPVRRLALQVHSRSQPSAVLSTSGIRRYSLHGARRNSRCSHHRCLHQRHSRS